MFIVILSISIICIGQVFGWAKFLAEKPCELCSQGIKKGRSELKNHK